MIIYHSYLIEDEIMVNSKALFQCVAVFHYPRFISRVLSIQKECISSKVLEETVVCEHGAPVPKMAKFFKSIFHTTDRRKAPHYSDHADADEERSESPQATAKRQLSISRSGRMRQANYKKRHSLTLELYGEAIQIDAVEKQQPMEYHVNTPSHTAPAVLGNRKSRFGSNDHEDVHPKKMDTSTDFDNIVLPVQKKLSTVEIDMTNSPEEEIDRAFEILDKS